MRADYGDSKIYVDVFNLDNGDMLQQLGLNWTTTEVGDDADVKGAIGLYGFQQLKDTADAVVDNNDERFELYTKAEAYLNDKALFIPYSTSGGNYTVSKVIPYSGLYGAYGLSSSKFKYEQVSDEVVTLAERDVLKAEWESKLEQ